MLLIWHSKTEEFRSSGGIWKRILAKFENSHRSDMTKFNSSNLHMTALEDSNHSNHKVLVDILELEHLQETKLHSGKPFLTRGAWKSFKSLNTGAYRRE